MSKEHDKEMEAFVEPIKQIDIPNTLRQSNQTAIARALEQERAKATQHWWQRRLSVPLPVAAAILLVLALQWVFQVYSFTRPQQPSVSTAKEKTQDNKLVAEQEESIEVQYQQESVYVAGLGVIHQAEIYHFEEM